MRRNIDVMRVTMASAASAVAGTTKQSCFYGGHCHRRVRARNRLAACSRQQSHLSGGIGNRRVNARSRLAASSRKQSRHTGGIGNRRVHARSRLAASPRKQSHLSGGLMDLAWQARRTLHGVLSMTSITGKILSFSLLCHSCSKRVRS